MSPYNGLRRAPVFGYAWVPILEEICMKAIVTGHTKGLGHALVEQVAVVGDDYNGAACARRRSRLGIEARDEPLHRELTSPQSRKPLLPPKDRPTSPT